MDEPILYAHNQEEHPPKHTGGLNTKEPLTLLLQIALSVVLFTMNSKTTAFHVKYSCRQNQNGSVV